MNEIKEALKREDMRDYVRMGWHVKQRLYERGYYASDITSCIKSKDSRIIEQGQGFNRKIGAICPSYTIEGVDGDGNPFAIVLSEEGYKQFSVITIMPPMDRRRFLRCV
ncbi:hypothetical protein KH400_15880 [Desertibacillus haloalkaliphilus]|nr:hypothetical protein [Desertibacillus haloalkaliphilus]